MSKKFYISHYQRTNDGAISYKISGNKTISSNIYNLSVDPLKITTALLKKAKVDIDECKKSEHEFISIAADNEHKEILLKTLEEVLEKRCSARAATSFKSIIRQLPFKVAIEESNTLLSLGIVHAIYTSSRGGYNIKTLVKYENSNLDCYQENDSKIWD